MSRMPLFMPEQRGHGNPHPVPLPAGEGCVGTKNKPPPAPVAQEGAGRQPTGYWPMIFLSSSFSVEKEKAP
jgi:hypothetical protein